MRVISLFRYSHTAVALQAWIRHIHQEQPTQAADQDFAGVAKARAEADAARLASYRSAGDAGGLAKASADAARSVPLGRCAGYVGGLALTETVVPCRACGDPIPVARLEAQPRTVTCSSACSRVHSATLRAGQFCSVPEAPSAGAPGGAVQRACGVVPLSADDRAKGVGGQGVQRQRDPDDVGPYNAGKLSAVPSHISGENPAGSTPYSQRIGKVGVWAEPLLWHGGHDPQQPVPGAA